MSDNVNEYGLGAPGTQSGDPVTHEQTTDPLAHGLGGSGEHDHGEEDVAEGGRHNRLEHGLAGGAADDPDVQPGASQPDPLRHGLGAAGE